MLDREAQNELWGIDSYDKILFPKQFSASLCTLYSIKIDSSLKV